MSPLEVAKSHLGLKEVAGEKSNPKINEMFSAVGHPEIKSDEISWCAAFVGYCLIQAGFKSTGSLAARSYLNWGFPIEIEKAQPGDVVVLWRVKPNSWQGHVFFYEAHNSSHIIGIGGNQSNAVTRAPFPRTQLLGIRRGTPAVVLPEKPPTQVKPVPDKEEKQEGFWKALMSFLRGLR